MKMTNPDTLDPIIHQPVRTRIVAFLAARGASTFNELKHELGITDGNLDAHMRKLTEVKYVRADKQTGSGRTQTFYELTSRGDKAFKHYVNSLKQLIEF